MKFSRYNLYVDVDNGLVIYNSKNGNYVNVFNEPEISEIKILLKKEHLDGNSNIEKQLYSCGYIVDNDVNEYELVHNFIKNHYEESKKTLRLMIYVTECCNFRCIYCPQKHKPITFSDNHWNALYKYIEKCFKYKRYENLFIIITR